MKTAARQLREAAYGDTPADDNDNTDTDESDDDGPTVTR